MDKFKNFILLLIPLISQARTWFYDSSYYVDWWLFYEYKDKHGNVTGVPVYWAVYFYGVYINYLIYMYCLVKPDGIYAWVKDFMLIFCILDILHLVLYAGKGFEITKLVLCITILLIKLRVNKRQWQMQSKF